VLVAPVADDTAVRQRRDLKTGPLICHLMASWAEIRRAQLHHSSLTPKGLPIQMEESRLPVVLRFRAGLGPSAVGGTALSSVIGSFPQRHRALRPHPSGPFALRYPYLATERSIGDADRAKSKAVPLPSPQRQWDCDGKVVLRCEHKRRIGGGRIAMRIDAHCCVGCFHLRYTSVFRTIAVCTNCGKCTLNCPHPNPSPVSGD